MSVFYTPTDSPDSSHIAFEKERVLAACRMKIEALNVQLKEAQQREATEAEENAKKQKEPDEKEEVRKKKEQDWEERNAWVLFKGRNPYAKYVDVWEECTGITRDHYVERLMRIHCPLAFSDRIASDIAHLQSIITVVENSCGSIFLSITEAGKIFEEDKK